MVSTILLFRKSMSGVINPLMLEVIPDLF